MIVFEEILDVAMLKAELVPPDWACETYSSMLPSHQFVVACHSPQLALTHEADDDDLAYQPVGFDTLRPAVAGVLRDVATGEPLARLFGVHLKATPASTATRLQQMQILADRLDVLDAANEQLPTLLLGDFNAHRAVDTHRASGDWTLIQEGFDAHPALGLSRVDYPFENTYRDREGHAYKLDHMWLAHAAATEVSVEGPCNLSWPAEQAAIESISTRSPTTAH